MEATDWLGKPVRFTSSSRLGASDLIALSQTDILAARLNFYGALELKYQQHGGHGLAWKTRPIYQLIEVGGFRSDRSITNGHIGPPPEFLRRPRAQVSATWRPRIGLENPSDLPAHRGWWLPI